MSTRLEKTIRREIEIDGEEYTVTISPKGFRLTKKRFRSGVALSWKAVWNRHRENGGVELQEPTGADSPA
jgi:hypothetical protein